MDRFMISMIQKRPEGFEVNMETGEVYYKGQYCGSIGKRFIPFRKIWEYLYYSNQLRGEPYKMYWRNKEGYMLFEDKSPIRRATDWKNWLLYRDQLFREHDNMNFMEKIINIPNPKFEGYYDGTRNPIEKISYAPGVYRNIIKKSREANKGDKNVKSKETINNE